jgi:hypothetical protein
MPHAGQRRDFWRWLGRSAFADTRAERRAVLV